MPEGPTILMMAEEAAKFVGRPVREASGNAKIAYSRLMRRKPLAIRSFGKQFLVDFGAFYLRAHLLLFGSWTSTIASFAPSPSTSAANRSSAGPAPRNPASCVIAFGSFTENLKRAGTAAAQVAQVLRRCGR